MGDMEDMYYLMEDHRNERAVSPFITSPPFQNSPNHILNALSDGCIQRVLTYLIGDIRDFLSAAEVCRKFQDNAKKCFPSIYTNFYMGCDSDDQLPLYRVKNFLSIFGHLIQSIKWESNAKNTYESEIFNAVVNFCGKNVLRLNVKYHHLDFNEALKLEILEELALFGGTIDNFKLPPNLKKLHLAACVKLDNMTWILQRYPTLSGIGLLNVDELNDRIVIEFQARNPQLKSFNISCQNVTSSILQGIATRVPNLVDLKFCFTYEGDKIGLQRKFEEDVMHLSGLRYLKSLDGINPHKMSTCPLIDVLADNDIPIEELVIDGLNSHIVKSLSRLTNIKKLLVYEFTSDMAIDLVKKVPKLQNLYIINAHLTLNNVKQILEQSTNLKSLTIRDKDMVLDSEILIESILDLAKERVQVELIVKYSDFHVSRVKYFKRKIEPYSQWLRCAVTF